MSIKSRLTQLEKRLPSTVDPWRNCRQVDIEAGALVGTHNGESMTEAEFDAGHIPGALSLPYAKNLTEEDTFRSPAELRGLYEPLIAGVPSQNVVFYCGSGVTSVHSILALLVAGLGESLLYAGSWSEWIAPRTRPVATGPNPF